MGNKRLNIFLKGKMAVITYFLLETRCTIYDQPSNNVVIHARKHLCSMPPSIKCHTPSITYCVLCDVNNISLCTTN